MEKILIVIQRITLVLCLFLIFLAIALCFVIDTEIYLNSILLLIILGLVSGFISIALYIVTHKYYDDYKCKENSFIKFMNKYNKHTLKTSIFLCVLSLLSAIAIFMITFDAKNIYAPVPSSVKIFLALFAIFGILSFIFLLCTPTPESTKSIKRCKYTDFNELKTCLENGLHENKFKTGAYYETESGYKVYTYYKRGASVEYYIVVNIDGYTGVDSLNELSAIINRLSYSPTNLLATGSVKTTILYCAQQRNDFFEKDFSTLLNLGRSYHYCFFAGILSQVHRGRFCVLTTGT